MNRFRIVVIGWNVGNYIERCLRSIIDQDFKNWTLCAVLDPSEDNTFEVSGKIKDSRIKLIKNNSRKYSLSNIISSIKEQAPDDEDIIATVDGDDWLANNDSLSIVDRCYREDHNLLATHGSWVSYPNPNVGTNNFPYTEEDFRIGVRKVAWKASHLRTYKSKVWKRIKDSDFRDEHGNYFISSGDIAIMLPILEMATLNRIKFIPELIYIYNQETPYSDIKTKLKEQLYIADYIRKMKPYEPI